MDITRNMNGARALVVGAGLALALAMGAAPTPAMAAGRVGTTKVMVRTEIDNVEFKVPTVIPFVAKADGTLQGPSEDATTIDNHSAYGIHVTNWLTVRPNLQYITHPGGVDEVDNALVAGLKIQSTF